MDFVANFMENTTVKKNENRSTFVKVMNECIVVVFVETRSTHIHRMYVHVCMYVIR